jgi:hypothetical protein
LVELELEPVQEPELQRDAAQDPAQTAPNVMFNMDSF